VTAVLGAKHGRSSFGRVHASMLGGGGTRRVVERPDSISHQPTIPPPTQV
jgi:hypothetical protein